VRAGTVTPAGNADAAGAHVIEDDVPFGRAERCVPLTPTRNQYVD